MDILFEETKSVFPNTKCGHYRRFIWDLMGESSTSLAAKIVFFISLNIWTLAIGLPDLKIKVEVNLTEHVTKLTKKKQHLENFQTNNCDVLKLKNIYLKNKYGQDCKKLEEVFTEIMELIQERDAIKIKILEILSSLEFVCNVWFLIEFVMKLVVAPQKKKFLKDPMNIIDILAIFPYWWYVLFFGDKDSEKRIVWLFQTIRTLMILIRILWSRWNSFYVQAMILALKYSFNQLQQLLQLFLVVSFILSGWCYQTGKDVPLWYGSWLYWAINTMTTSECNSVFSGLLVQ